MKNTFTSTQVEFVNIGLHALFGELLTVRTQIMIAAETNGLAGWSDGLNEWMKKYFGVIASDLDRLKSANNAGPPMSNMSAHLSVSFDLTGQDLNLVQPTQDNCRSHILRSIIQILDRLAVQVTHFDSRWRLNGINDLEWKQANTFLEFAYDLCERHGGNANDRELISGVLPRDLDNGFNFDGSSDAEFGTLDVGDMKSARGFRVGGNGGGTAGTGNATAPASSGIPRAGR